MCTLPHKLSTNRDLWWLSPEYGPNLWMLLNLTLFILFVIFVDLKCESRIGLIFSFVICLKDQLKLMKKIKKVQGWGTPINKSTQMNNVQWYGLSQPLLSIPIALLNMWYLDSTLEIMKNNRLDETIILSICNVYFRRHWVCVVKRRKEK